LIPDILPVNKEKVFNCKENEKHFGCLNPDCENKMFRLKI